ncbi:putative tail spike associated glycoside hydrolase [Erwinia phage pEa_SNUABM_5]|uniref:Putative tail spike associated glycoside hydrolase n=1 Tax=Erwinia phage pEa_SNUABM_5 TaxID=2797313 RepID=A0A7T8EPQ5_9CAUD|nr:putative tail spike associated glycoside hydrolase [Erwinia phage pEa_SNUABM_5]QQO90400.1 putative tail spike associated glycoside hydrolase [Erwinia phage pEa_SNUABM_5]
MIEVNSFAELRTTPPTKAGDTAYLKRYYDKDSKFRGGGWFVGFPQKNTPADDGGINAVGKDGKGNPFFWQRVVDDPAAINILHFGARLDGKTDDSDAYRRNFMWVYNMKDGSDTLGVSIPSGPILLSPMDFTDLGEIPVFAMYGDTRCEKGWRPRVRIVSDKSNKQVIKVNARRVVIHGFNWNGQCTAQVNGKKVDPETIKGAIMPEQRSNNQIFFENVCPAGQFVGIRCFRGENVGGSALKFQDTLDTSITEIYGSKIFGAMIEAKWSNTVAGGWNHSTAVRLEDGNFQFGYGPAVLDMPRMTQAIMKNIWIEHTRFPGNLNDGQWVFEANSIESSDNPLNLANTRCVVNGFYFQGQGTMSLERKASTDNWLSGYERGNIRIETYGILMTDACFRPGYYTGYKITNNTDQDKWFYIGSYSFPKVNQTWQIELLGTAPGVVPNTKLQQPTQMDGMGRRVITMTRCIKPQKKVYADMHMEGTDAIADVVYQRLWEDYGKVWVKLKANSGDTIFNITTTGPTRFEAGQCTLFSDGPCECTDPTLAEMTVSVEKNQKDYARPQQRFSLHNGLAGIGANEQGMVTMQTAEGKAPKDLSKPAGFTSININGVDRVVPYY